jgi:hypothetical protein
VDGDIGERASDVDPDDPRHGYARRVAVRSFPTPNPNAMKLVVGREIGVTGTGPQGGETDVAFAAELLGVEGVASIFFTADFVTITRAPSVEWDAILTEAVPILERAFPD